MTIPGGTVFGRGRGRGRARIRSQQMDSDADISSQASFYSAKSSGDVVDACVAKAIRDYGDRYKDDYSSKTGNFYKLICVISVFFTLNCTNALAK